MPSSKSIGLSTRRQGATGRGVRYSGLSSKRKIGVERGSDRAPVAREAILEGLFGLCVRFVDSLEQGRDI